MIPYEPNNVISMDSNYCIYVNILHVSLKNCIYSLKKRFEKNVSILLSKFYVQEHTRDKQQLEKGPREEKNEIKTNDS